MKVKDGAHSPFMQMSAGTSEPVPIKRVPSSSSDYCGDRNSVESALEDLESKYTCVPTDLEPCISFVSLDYS